MPSTSTSGPSKIAAKPQCNVLPRIGAALNRSVSNEHLDQLISTIAGSPKVDQSGDMTDLRSLGVSSTGSATGVSFGPSFPKATDKVAVIHGFGAIGRGYFGEIFRRNGFQIVGIDRPKDRSDQINASGKYNIILQGRKQVVETVDHASVVDSTDASKVSDAYLKADIAGLALVEGAFAEAAKSIAAGLIARENENKSGLTLVLALNKVGAGAFARDAIKAELDRQAPEVADKIFNKTIISETVVNRMARNPNAEEAKTDSTAVITEPFYTLYAQEGSPALFGLAQVETVADLAPYEEMKLFLSNCAHAVVAYEGYQKGYTYIDEAMKDPEIHSRVEEVLYKEAGPAFAKKWDIEPLKVKDYCDAVVERFENENLKDEITRVARNPIRKIGRNDRLVGTALMVLEQGGVPENLVHTLASAMLYDPEVKGDDQPQKIQLQLHSHDKRGDIRSVMEEWSGMSDAPKILRRMVEHQFEALKEPRNMANGPINSPEVFLKGVENPKGLQASLADLGIGLDLETGHLSYNSDFEKLDLPYNLMFVRHGQTHANIEPRHFQGQVNEWKNQLTDFGKDQASGAADKLIALEKDTGWKPDAIYTSPLGRASDTANPYLEKTGQEITPYAGIQEMSFGTWDNRRVASFDDDDRCHLFYQHQNALVKSEGGENFAELILRAKESLTGLSKENTGKNVLMFSHSMFGAATAILLGKGKETPEGHLGFDGPYIFPHATPTPLN